MPITSAVLSAIFALIPPSSSLAPPRGDAQPDDIVVLARIIGARPTADCGVHIWRHHPLDLTRPGRYCAAWLTLPDRAPILVIGAVGAPPAALAPIIHRPVIGSHGVITAKAPGPDPDLRAAITDALAGWTEP